jgi:DedD protein
MLKQRLVGILVLVALGIVFWPLIFTQPEDREPLVLGPMPEQPEIDRTPLAPPQSFRESVEGLLPDGPVVSEADQDLADDKTRLNDDAVQNVAAELSQLGKPEESPVRETPPAMDPLIDDDGLPRLWVLQVATVSSVSRADTLVAVLRQREYKAFSTQYQRKDQTLYRVQIGPNAERQRLEKIKPNIDQALSVDSQILRYSQ